MASQWPQNHHPPQGYGYSQYPQQYSQPPPPQYSQQSQQYAQQQPPQYPAPYAQHQYPQYPQQPVQQQYPPQHGAQYGGQYPPTANASYVQPNQPQQNQQGCYNCGGHGHWAQDCQEPKREVPAGAYNRPPPFKRHKPNPPVVTKYAVPPHVQQNQAQPPNAYGMQYPPQNYPQYQGPPGPPTPMSGQSPSHQQWQQQPHQQQYHQSYQQQHYQQSYPQQTYPQQQQQYSQPYQQASYQQQQQPYMPTAPTTPATPYGSQYGSQASPQAAHTNAANYFHNNQYQQQSGPPSQPMANVSPVSSVSQTMTYQQHQHPTPAAAQKTNNHSISRTSSVSMHSMSITPKQQSVEAPEEVVEDDDDLSKLDIPDIPVITADSFASLVDRPLPANFIVADALEPFDAPKPESSGRCSSKYVVLDASSTFLSSIKDTKHWDDLKNDPVFLSIHDNNTMISLEKITSLYCPRTIHDQQDHGDIEEGECTQQKAVQHEEDQDLMGSLEHSLSANHHLPKAPSTVSRTGSWDRAPRRDSFAYNRTGRQSEEAVTSHRLDVARKPSHSFVPPPPARIGSPAPSPERTPPMRTRTPSMYELDELYQQEYGVKPGGTTCESMTNGHSLATLDPFEPPPPPPPAQLRKPASYDGVSEEALLAGSPNGNANASGCFESHHRSGSGRSYSNGHASSPTQFRSDAANGRKRDYDQQVVSDEDHTPKRRQVDDTKFKLKKRQPKVAAAYSRRW